MRVESSSKTLISCSYFCSCANNAYALTRSTFVDDVIYRLFRNTSRYSQHYEHFIAGVGKIFLRCSYSCVIHCLAVLLAVSHLVVTT